MNASALLSKQGWRGTGFSLDKTDRGLAKPLLVARKVEGAGLGTKNNDFSNQWWLKAWDSPSTSQAKATTAVQEQSSAVTRILGRNGLYSNFVQAETLGGTLEANRTHDIPTVTDATMAETVESKPKSAKKDKSSKKRKREEEAASAVAAQVATDEVAAADDTKPEKKKSKKEKKEKKSKKDKSRDLTPDAEDVEDVFFIDTTGSATAPVEAPQKPVSLAKADKAAEMSAKRVAKLEKKQAKKAAQSPKASTHVQEAESGMEADDELTKMDTDADFVAIGDQPDEPQEAGSADALSSRKTGDMTWGKLHKSTQKYLRRKAAREAKGKPNATDVKVEASGLESMPPKKEKRKKFKFLTPEEKAERTAGQVKVNKAEKYARERAKRETKRAWKASIMTPELKAAEEKKKKEQKLARKEKAERKAAEGEARKLSRNQRKAAKREAKRQSRTGGAPAPAAAAASIAA